MYLGIYAEILFSRKGNYGINAEVQGQPSTVFSLLPAPLTSATLDYR